LIPTGHWSVAGRDLDLAAGLIVGVLNVTPDSFSGDGVPGDVSAARDHARGLTSDGAAVIDVGGESTRPGAKPVALETEIDRVLPVVDDLLRSELVVSVDTYEPALAKRAVAAGAHIVNDVMGFADPRMVEVAADSDCGVVVMCGRDARLDTLEETDDVVEAVEQYLLERVEILKTAGVDDRRIVVDPGLGFAKTATQSLQLIAGVDRLVARGLSVMIGASRKGFLSRVTGGNDTWEARDRATATISALSYIGGARIFRVHDVSRSRDALRVAAAIVAHH
jgi:dihydropteroate synthase